VERIQLQPQPAVVARFKLEMTVAGGHQAEEVWLQTLIIDGDHVSRPKAGTQRRG
jgi:hypothetical protein